MLQNEKGQKLHVALVTDNNQEHVNVYIHFHMFILVYHIILHKRRVRVKHVPWRSLNSDR